LRAVNRNTEKGKNRILTLPGIVASPLLQEKYFFIAYISPQIPTSVNRADISVHSTDSSSTYGALRAVKGTEEGYEL
jgi:hypothetical protein